MLNRFSEQNTQFHPVCQAVTEAGVVRIAISGDWTLAVLDKVHGALGGLGALPKTSEAPLIDLSALQMLDTAGQSGQALVFCLRYDFPAEWSAFINGTSAFQMTLETYYFPYMVQGARKLTIDSLVLYAAEGNKVVSVTPKIDLGAMSSNLTSPAANAAISLPPDPSVLIRTQQQRVFMVLQYHFGAN